MTVVNPTIQVDHIGTLAAVDCNLFSCTGVYNDGTLNASPISFLGSWTKMDLSLKRLWLNTKGASDIGPSSRQIGFEGSQVTVTTFNRAPGVSQAVFTQGSHAVVEYQTSASGELTRQLVRIDEFKRSTSTDKEVEETLTFTTEGIPWVAAAGDDVTPTAVAVGLPDAPG